MEAADMVGLSETERAALREDDAVGATPGGGGTGGAGPVTRVVEADGSITEVIGGDDDDDEAPAAAAVSDADDAGDDAFQPQYIAPPIEGLQDKFAELDTAESVLETKFNDGEMTFDEYKAAAKAIQNQRVDLRVSSVKAEISTESAQQAAEQKWDWECGRFMKQTARIEGIDYRAEANKPLMQTLNLFVKVLADDPGHADKDGEALLAEAHRLTKLRHNMQTVRAPAVGAPGKAKDAVTEAIDKRKPQLKGVSDTTVAHLPSAGESKADAGVAGSSEFADLDGLDGFELERRCAAMPKDVEARYLAQK